MTLQEQVQIMEKIFPRSLLIGAGYYYIPVSSSNLSKENTALVDQTDWYFQKEDDLCGWFLDWC